MAAANITHVRYFVPYDGDTEEHPNVFVVRKPMKGLTLADLQSVSRAASYSYSVCTKDSPASSPQAFPLPGSYLFRAKQAYGKAHGM